MSEEIYESFSKIPRLNRNCTITEKIDGSASQVSISQGIMKVGSKNRWLSEKEDNFGFWRWCQERKEELLKLGEGNHWGEFWGSGIQRGYGLKEKRFSLFNTYKWSDESVRPRCCHVVPVIYQGPFNTVNINALVAELKLQGSVAAPGFLKPEGLIVFHEASRGYFKITCEKDEKAKNQQ